MPGLANRRNKVCCLAREPPSPDALSPRPASAKFHDKYGSVDKYYLKDTSSIVSPPITQTTASDLVSLQVISSRRCSADVSADEHTLRDNNSDHINQLHRSRLSLSSPNLAVLKKNLRKHLSKDSGILKRRSQSSIGQSEEEVGRRAELRRIRQKRIEAEMSDAFYETDLESSETIATSGAQDKPAWVAGSTLSLLKLDLPALEMPTLDLPTLSPMLSMKAPNRKPSGPAISDTLARRHSSPLLGNFDHSFADPRVYIPSRKQSFSNPEPSTPHIEPQRLPSIVESTRSAWRLSFVSPNRADQLRNLSREYAEPPITEISTLISKPGEHLLHVQGFGASFEPASLAAGPPNVSRSINNADSYDFGGVDGPRPSITLEAQQLLLKIEEGAQKIPSSLGNASLPSIGEAALEVRQSAEPNSAINHSLVAQEQTTNTVFSTFASRLFGLRRHLGDINKLSDEDTRVQYSIAPVPKDDQLAESGSIDFIETHSYLEREAELNAIKTRFAQDEQEQRPSTPRSSKLTEHFRGPRSSSTSKDTSVSFFRVSKFGFKTYDGAHATEDLLAVPMPQFDRNDDASRDANHSSTIGDFDVISKQWGKAMAANDATKKSNLERVTSSHERSSNPLRAEIQRSKDKKNDKKRKEHDNSLTAAQQYEKRFQERLAIKEMAMNDWEAEMEAGAQKAKDKSRHVMHQHKPTGADRRFPMSWSRYPSHTREVRTASAGKTEQVASHDFAMRLNADGENVFYQCRETEDGHIHDDNPDWHKYDPKSPGFMERLEDQVSQTVYKIEVHGGGGKPFEFQKNGRRGSMTVAGKVQYPELELLAISPGVTGLNTPLVTSRSSSHNASSPTKSKFYFDGANDNDDEVEDSVVSIADPEFYKDCLIEITESRFNTPGIPLTHPPVSTITRSITWNGRGSKRGRSLRGRNVSLEDISLHGSTQDFYEEIIGMEQAELSKLLSMIKAG